MGVSRVNNIGGLVVVDCLSEGIVEEDILGIQLVNRPARERAKVRIVRMIAGFTMGLKVSS
jgi:hypothetical protein